MRDKKKVKLLKSFFRLFADFNEEDEDMDTEPESEEETPNLFLVNDTVEQLIDVYDYSLEYYFDVAENLDSESGDFGDDDGSDSGSDDSDNYKTGKSKYQLSNLLERKYRRKKAAKNGPTGP